MALVQYSYIGKGSVWIKRRGAAAPRVRMGNTSKLTLGVDEDSKEMLDYESAGGGKLENVSRIKAVTLEMENSNLSPENLAIGLRGEVTSHTGALVTDEVVAVIKGGLSMTEFLPDPAEALTVKDTTGTTTYDEGDDYIRTRSGIEIPTGSSISNGTVKVTYTSLDSAVLEALVKSGDEYELVFEGLNEARSGSPVVVETYRAKFSPSGCDLIGDDFGNLKLKAELLSDDTKVGAGVSKFFRARIAKLA